MLGGTGVRSLSKTSAMNHLALGHPQCCLRLDTGELLPIQRLRYACKILYQYSPPNPPKCFVM